MKKSSYCYTTSSTEFYASNHPSINSIPDINEFIHILLSLADLSLIYSCRLHGPSICHATWLINLHTDCISGNQEICLSSMLPFIYHILLSLADLFLIYSCRIHGQSIYHIMRSINLHTGCIPRDREICLPSRDRGTCLPVTQLIHPHTSCVLRDGGTCVSTGHSMANLHISCMFRDRESAYQLHTPWSSNLSIGHDQSIS